MPGLIVSIPVEVGQDVERGDRVVVLQAMKMENELTSPRAGRVSVINAAEGQTVEQGFVLVVLDGEQGG
jgi:biotin carboxyl carrier protein